MVPIAALCHVVAEGGRAVPILLAGGLWHRGQALMSLSSGKTPEDVVRRYIQKVKNPPDEVSGGLGGLREAQAGDGQRAEDDPSFPLDPVPGRIAPSAWSGWSPPPDTRAC